MRRFRSMRSIMRWLPKLLGVVVLGVIMVWMGHGFQSRVGPGELPYERPQAGTRAVVTVHRLSTTETALAVGTVQPRRKAEVASQLLATVREVHVNAGDAVALGRRLIVLDDREIQTQLHEAEAAVAAVQADLTVRARDYERSKRMFAAKAVTKEDFDRVAGALQVTEAQLRRAQQQVERITVMLSYATIRSPQAGIVSNRFTDPGDLATPGKPLLAIHDPTDLELHASVREGLAAHVNVGMTLRACVDAAGLDAQCTVREIVPQAEAASRSLLVKVSLPHQSTERLYIGMFGRLTIGVGKTDRTVVAAAAIQRIGQLEVVDVVGKDNTLERRYVRVGERFGEEVEILAGLRINERVALPAGTRPSETAA